MPRCETTHFGAIEHDPTTTIHFSEGLPGFESQREFVVLQLPHQHPLVFLQSVENPNLCFPALPVGVIEPLYEPLLSDRDLELLDLKGQPEIGKDAIILCLVSLHEDGATANLLAPIVVNLRTRAAAQCIDAEMRYAHRHSLIQQLERAS